jgi:thiol-disulfide isomerase/thioredoxin
MKFPVVCLTAVVIGLISKASAALKSGDDAPKVKVGSWAQGEGVKEFEGDKVYIVEFWATWCGPCVAAIPHLNETYKKHKAEGLVVVGSNLGEDAATVSKFVKGMAGKMTYNVAVDDPADGGWMAKHWLTAAGQNGIPCAFVVSKKGKIAFIGHPMELKESLLESLLAEPSSKASTGPQGPAKNVTPSAQAIELANKAQSEIRAGKFDEAESTIARLQEALSENLGYLGGLMELDLLLGKQQPNDALELSRLLVEDYAKNPAVLASVAAHLISQPAPTAPLQAAAEKIATPLADSAGEAQGSALSTLARIAFLKGDKPQAQELQKKALPLLPKTEEPAAKATLESYQ